MLRPHAHGEARAGPDSALAQRHRERVAAGDGDVGSAVVDGGDGAVQEVHMRRAGEAGNEAVGRPVVQLVWRAHLLDAARAQHHDAVGEGHRLDLVVGDVDHRGLEAGVQGGDPRALRPGGAQIGVEVRQRLVEQEGDRPARDGAADGDTLTLAAGELAGAALQQLFDLEHSRRIGDARGDLRLRQPSVLQPEGGK